MCKMREITALFPAFYTFVPALQHSRILHRPAWIKPKKPARPGHVKIALVITAVDFDQFSLYSTSTSLFSNDHI